MAIQVDEYVSLTRQEIASSGLGSTPKAVAAFESLQQAAYDSNPQAAANAQAAAQTAAQDAAEAAAVGTAAQASADSALSVAQAAATDAATRVPKDATPVWTAPAGTVARTVPSYTAPTVSVTYTAAELQAAVNQVQALTRTLVGLITDLRAIHALKNS